MNFQEKVNNRIQVDFNELIEENLVMLSNTDYKSDYNGNDIMMTEGMRVKIYEYNDYGDEEELLLAEGIVELTTYKEGWASNCKWNCRIDKNGIKIETKKRKSD